MTGVGDTHPTCVLAWFGNIERDTGMSDNPTDAETLAAVTAIVWNDDVTDTMFDRLARIRKLIPRPVDTPKAGDIVRARHGSLPSEVWGVHGTTVWFDNGTEHGGTIDAEHVEVVR